MRTPSTRSLLTIPFAIPAYWTSGQALAVVGLLEDIRDEIWSHYAVQLRGEYREPYRDPSGVDGPSKAVIALPIPAYWTPEQALAVIELLEDLRDKICSHYAAQLFEEYRRDRGALYHEPDPDGPDDPDDPPF